MLNEPHLPRSHGRRGRDLRRGRDRLGWTGPCLRGDGVLRRPQGPPVLGLRPEFEFDVPVGTVGDNYDRATWSASRRFEQSMRILEQAMVQIPPGPVLIDDPICGAAAEEREVYNTIEGMIATSS
jgi:NADH-quinone oxidoreductase subunit D